MDEVIEMPAVLGVVAAGRGVALVPASVARLHFDGVILKPVKPQTRSAEVWLSRRADEHRQVVIALYRMIAAMAEAGPVKPKPRKIARR